MGKTLSLTAALLLASTANAQDIIVHDNLITGHHRARQPDQIIKSRGQ